MEKITFLLLAFIVALSSCQEEDIDSIDSNSVTKGLITKELESSNRELCPNFDGDNNLDSCSTVYNLNPINSLTDFNHGNNGSGYIDYELEYYFSRNCDYSHTCIQPGAAPNQTITGEIEFYEYSTYVIDPVLGDTYVYYYLSDENDITASNANELADFFACKLDEFKSLNMPNGFFDDINFYGERELCSSKKMLKVSFTLKSYSEK